MGLKPTAISMQIDSLERDLNVVLFTKKGRTVQPTEAALKLMPMIQPLIEGLDSVFERFHTEQHQTQVITIATNNHSMHYLLPDLVAGHRKHNPDLTYTIHNMPREQAYDALKRDEVDIYVGAVGEIPDYADFTLLHESPIVLVLRAGHPLQRKRDITIRQLQSYELIRLDSPHAVLPTFEEIVKFYGLKGDIRLTGVDWQMLKNFIRVTDGYTFVSKLAIQPYDIGLITKPFTHTFPPIRYGILVKKGRFLPEHSMQFINTCKGTFL